MTPTEVKKTPEEQAKEWRASVEEDRAWYLASPRFQSIAQCPKCLQTRDKFTVSYRVWSRCADIWKADFMRFEVVMAMKDLEDVEYMVVKCQCEHYWFEACADRKVES